MAFDLAGALTIEFVDSSDVSRVARRTIFERNSPNLRAGPVMVVMDPSFVKKCVRSVIHVDPICCVALLFSLEGFLINTNAKFDEVRLSQAWQIGRRQRLKLRRSIPGDRRRLDLELSLTKLDRSSF